VASFARSRDVLNLWLRGQFFGHETTGFMRAVAEGFDLGLAAAAESNGRLIGGEREWLALVIEQCELAFDEERTIVTTTNIDGHMSSKDQVRGKSE
jgi:hypothetical protein